MEMERQIQCDERDEPDIGVDALQDDSHVVWRVIGASVRGATHARNGLPNQDAIRWRPSLDGRDSKPPYILAVADGHGQVKSVRSDRGSNIAVDVAIDVLQDYAASLVTGPDLTLSKKKELAEKRLPHDIVDHWKKKVEADASRNAFTADELKRLGEASTRPQMDAPSKSQLKAYGTTLLAVLVTEDCIVGLQIGDGDILSVSEEGGVSHLLPRDPLNFANETTSLSGRHAIENMRFTFKPNEGAVPVLLLLCTDGYSNAFQKTDLKDICREYLRDLREPGGWRTVFGYLEENLKEATNEGSGDDATVGILFRETGERLEQADCAVQTVSQGSFSDEPTFDTVQAPMDTTGEMPSRSCLENHTAPDQGLDPIDSTSDRDAAFGQDFASTDNVSLPETIPGNKAENVESRNPSERLPRDDTARKRDNLNE